jgi:carboxylesterase
MVHGQKAGKAVLCCHGFPGYPGELVRPGMDLYEAGFDVFAPRYPGHGTSGDDFIASRGADWIGTAMDAYADLKKRYDEVYLVGHSMGGIIAILVADAFDVKRIALLAPALLVPAIPVCRLRFLKAVKKRIKSEWHPDPEYKFHWEGDEGDDLFLGKEYWSYLYPRQVWELEKLRRRAVSCLDRLQADTLSVSGGLDKTIPVEASLLAVNRKLGANKHVHIPNATHLMPYDKDLEAQDEAMKAVVDWLLG